MPTENATSKKDFPVNRRNFTADTGRRHSHSKRHSKIRHVLAIVSVMCPLSALFVYLMSLFKLPVQRTGYYHLCIAFLAAGLVALFFYLIAYANQQRRHRISEINRAERHRRQDEALRAEREALAAKRAAQNPPPASPPSSRDGLALVLALAAVALLSGLSAWLFAQALASHRAAARAAATARLRSAALQSLHAAMDVLRRDDPALDAPSDLWALPASASFDGIATRSLTDDASAFFPWNLFAATNAPSSRSAADVFCDWMAASGRLASDTLAAAAADFTDPDSAGPYEAPFYARLPRPYEPPNRALEAPADLLLLPGFLPAVSAPPSATAIYPADPVAQSAVVPLPPDLAPTVNLNTAPPALLLGLFGIDRDDLVRALLALRAAAPIASVDALAALDPSLPAALAPLLSVSSSVFRIRATATLGTAALTLSAWVRRAPDGSVSILQYWEEPGVAA